MVASDIAKDRGGYLAEINNSAEHNAIFNEIVSSSIDTSNTIARIGFGNIHQGNDAYASYIWLGGNDISGEGDWIWDGDNNQSGAPFWMGTQSGSAIGGSYVNWGNGEPSDFQTQDGLAVALTLGAHPHVSVGDWDDIDINNTLYFVIEYN